MTWDDIICLGLALCVVTGILWDVRRHPPKPLTEEQARDHKDACEW